VNPKTVQLLARHSDIKVTLAAYAKVGTDDLKDAINKLP